jgi:putative transposase
LERLFGE